MSMGHASDATAPPSPACALDTAELRARANDWAALAARAVVDRVQMPGGVRLRFRREAGVEEELRRLVDLEAACCPFLVFGVEPASEELVLSVRGPAGVADLDRGGRSALVASIAAPVRLHEHTAHTTRSEP
jgi:hypothetical protein